MASSDEDTSNVTFEGVGPKPELRANVQADHREGLSGGTIAWSEHVKAWEEYARRYGRYQSALRIHERWGFSRLELREYLGHEPTTFEPHNTSGSRRGE